MKVYGVIYLLINSINDKEYVGQTTKTAEERFKEHMYSPHCIGKAIRKHGAENFVIVILKVCYSKAELDFWEKHFIKSRNTMAPNGYNLTEGGAGFTPSPETCLKISVPQRKESPFKNLAKEICQSKFTYGMLSKRMNTTQYAISSKMLGRRNFTETEWAKLAEIFGKPVDYLMVRDDDKPSVSKLHNSPYKNLIWEIDKRKLTYIKLAQIMELPRMNFSAKMNGKCNFSEAEWAKLVEIFGLPADYLMFRSDGLPAIISKAEKNAKISKSKRKNTPYKNLVCEMEKKQLTYKMLAKLVGTSDSSINNFACKMRGEQNFTAKDIAKLVEIFGKPADYLMARSDGLPAITSEAERRIKLSASNRHSTPFKNLLCEIREHKLSYRTLATFLGLCSTSISHKMLGRQKFTAKDIAKLVEIFGKPADYLMKRDDTE